MKTISNQTCKEIKDILRTFSQLRGSDALAQVVSSSTRLADAQRRAMRILKKLAEAVDKVDARKCTGSQKAAILQMLKEGERITADDALQLCGCRRLSARIWELVHHDGHDIRRELASTPEGNRCVQYYMKTQIEE